VESWLQFFAVTAVLGGLGLAIWMRGELDERRWKREREAEQAARRPAE
jgi:hypothetical protein